jgi:SAM-dependent methyltransferase
MVNDNTKPSFPQIVAKGLRVARRLAARCHLVAGTAETGLPPFPATRALAWLRNNHIPGGGVCLYPGHVNGCAGISGDLVSTLLRYGERDRANDLVKWLVCSQRANGAFIDPNSGLASLFDTSQVLRGLCAGRELLPQAPEAARRAANYVVSQLTGGERVDLPAPYWLPQGEAPSQDGSDILLYALPPLREASQTLNEPRFVQVAQQLLDRFLGQKAALRAGGFILRLTYQLEALIDLGRPDLALPVLDALVQQQAPDGSVPGEQGVAWVCLPGLAQLAVCWYKTGRADAADKAVAYLTARQQTSGGLLGSYGMGAAYFPDREVPWAVKIFLDAHALRSVSLLERDSKDLTAHITPDDPQVQTVLSVVRAGDKVLEIGCSEGGILQAIRAARPECECCGLPGSAALPARLPEGIRPVAGYLESVPEPEDAFDVVFVTDGALERSANPERVVAESIRLTKRGGWLVLFNKQRGDWKRAGKFGSPAAEIELRKLLNRKCDRVSVERLARNTVSNGRPGNVPEVWRAQKRSPLSGPEWFDALVSPANELQMGGGHPAQPPQRVGPACLAPHGSRPKSAGGRQWDGPEFRAPGSGRPRGYGERH